jgi:hypothetical protein
VYESELPSVRKIVVSDSHSMGGLQCVSLLHSVREFREESRATWRRLLSRRSRGKPMTWTRFARLEERYSLPRARVVHGLAGRVAKS